jgi:putative ABC transport system permease protein
VFSYRDLVDEWLRGILNLILVVGSLGAVASVLSLIGIFGLLAFTVAQRTREIGVRMALGAPRDRILQLVLRQGMILGLAGIGFGLAAGLVLTRLLSGLLLGVSVLDPWTLAGASFLVVILTLLACFIPARRAAQVDPMVALKYE